MSINILDLPDDWKARQLTLRLNNKGTPDRIGLAKELAKQQEHFGESTGTGLPWSANVLAELIALASTDMPVYDREGVTPGDPDVVALVFKLHKDAADVVEQAIARAKKEGEADDRGVALERICADFLASAEVAG